MQCEGIQTQVLDRTQMPSKLLPTVIFNPLEDQENQQPPAKAQRPRTPLAGKKSESRPSSRLSSRTTNQPAFNSSRVPQAEVERLLQILYVHAGPHLATELKLNSKLWVEYTKAMNRRAK